MLSSLVDDIQRLVVSYGIWGVFGASLLEEIIVPIPSALVMMGAGFFFLDNVPLSLYGVGTLLLWVALPAAVGTTLGSLLIYSLGYYSGRPALVRWGKYFGISWHDIERVQAYFKKGWTDEMLLVAVRTIPIVPGVAVSAFCGLVRLPLFEYLTLSVVGTFLRAMIMGFIGWQVGSFYLSTARQFEQAERWVFFAIIVAVLGFVVWRAYRKRNV